MEDMEVLGERRNTLAGEVSIEYEEFGLGKESSGMKGTDCWRV